MLRILLCAPNSNLDTAPEIRDLTALHTVTVLTGNVTTRDLYTTANARHYDIIHFACHGDETGIYLNKEPNNNQPNRNLQPSDNTDHIPANEIAQIARSAGAKLIWLNACTTTAIAANIVNHGINYCIAAVINIQDQDAWKTPLTFYTKLQTINDEEIIEAFQHANNEQQYIMAVAPKLLLAIFATITALREALTADVQIKIPKRYIMIAIPTTVLLYIILLYLSWR